MCVKHEELNKTQKQEERKKKDEFGRAVAL